LTRSALTAYKRDQVIVELPFTQVIHFMNTIIANKAVLIYPEFDNQNTFWSYGYSLSRYMPSSEFGLPKRLLPPLGLMGLYRFLKPYYHSIQLIDKNIDPRPLDQLIEDANHIFIGGMSAQQNNLLELAKISKQMGKIVILGGTAVTPDSKLNLFADHLVENEAESIMDTLMLNLRLGKTHQYYRGTPGPAEDFFQPDYSSIKLDNYIHMAVQISRGCPEKCEFCDIPSRFGKAFRVTPWEKTAHSFRQLKQLGWNGQVFIVDDNFIGHPKKTLLVLKNLYKIGEEIGYHHPKYTELTLRLADNTEIMAKLRHWFRKAHFINGFYGVESPNTASLLETQKKQNLRGNTSLLDKLRFISEQTGSGVMMGMIYGFDHDDQETVQKFIDFINASHAPIVMAGLLNALPHTPLITRLKKQQRYIQPSSGNNSDAVINFIPNHLSVQQAELNYLQIVEAIYQPAAYFKRVLRHLQLIDPTLQSQYRNRQGQLKYLYRILSGKNARFFWRYLPQALMIAHHKSNKDRRIFTTILAEYFSLCAQFTHFSSQVKAQHLAISTRHYHTQQKQSWQQMQRRSSR